jgi:hypothetical protein
MVCGIVPAHMISGFEICLQVQGVSRARSIGERNRRYLPVSLYGHAQEELQCHGNHPRANTESQCDPKSYPQLDHEDWEQLEVHSHERQLAEIKGRVKRYDTGPNHLLQLAQDF